jgi:hypothetical protein
MTATEKYNEYSKKNTKKYNNTNNVILEIKMSDEELINTIMDIDVLLLEMESALLMNDHASAKRKVRQARGIIADMQEYDEGDSGSNTIILKAE